MASLVGIRILCKLGCTVVFTDAACYVFYQEQLILTGHKDPSTDLWVLPITPEAINEAKLRTSQGQDILLVQSQASPYTARAPQCPKITTPPREYKEAAMFTHSVRTRANAVKFAHQSMCNPKISSLMKALQKGFLKGCPNLSEELVTKYLNPNPAMAKGHMKRPKKGIRSTTKLVKTKGDSNGARNVPGPQPQAAPACYRYSLNRYHTTVQHTVHAGKYITYLTTKSRLQMCFVLEPSPTK